VKPLIGLLLAAAAVLFAASLVWVHHGTVSPFGAAAQALVMAAVLVYAACADERDSRRAAQARRMGGRDD
jgi:peptidoglycan/LPS O-acetylase OafA/YrhL